MGLALPTEFVQGALVSLAANDSFEVGLSFGLSCLKGDNPPITLSQVRGLESVLVVVIFESEISRSCFGHIFDIGLSKRQVSYRLLDDIADQAQTKLIMPCGWGLSSARLAKNNKPLPVWVA